MLTNEIEYEIGDLVEIPIMKLNAIVIESDEKNVILFSYYNNGCTMSGPFERAFVKLISRDTKTKPKLKDKVITKELLEHCTLEIEEDCKN